MTEDLTRVMKSPLHMTETEQEAWFCEHQAQAKAQRRDERKAAKAFVRVCRDGDYELVYDAATWLDQGMDAWRLAMAGVAKLPRVSPEIQGAFVPIWVMHKMLPLKVGDRSVLARALRVLMPGARSGSPLTLYRGASVHERRRRRWGFSWTTDPGIARGFAEWWAQPKPPGYRGDWDQGGVVLQTVAPPPAILLVRPPEDWYDEGEVVVDPYRLGKVTVHETLVPPPRG